MNKSQSEARRFKSAYALAPALALATMGVLIGLMPRSPATLSAEASTPVDLDLDGLVDGQERILETIVGVQDSDLDGYGDAEELARKTSPVMGQVHPEGEAMNVGITARGDRNGLHALVAIYLPPDTDFRGTDVKVGLLLRRRLVYLSTSTLLSRGTLEFVPGASVGSTVALIDFRFPRTWVDMTGHLTMFATVSQADSHTINAAAAMDLFSSGGIVLLAMPNPTLVPGQHDNGGLAVAGNGVVYKPLTLYDFDPPPDWTMSEVCVQTSQNVGTGGGAIVIHEVSSAECQSGWEGACPPSCSSSVGTTFTTVDPSILVGG